MIKFVHICLAVFLLAPAAALAAPPSDASLKELMELVEVRKLVEAMPTQVTSSMDALVQQALQGKAATPHQQQAIDTMKKRVSTLLSTDFSYAKMESMWLPVYREAFSAEEVAGMIAFYKSPAGQSLIHKMPVVMQKTMEMQQQVMVPLMPKIQAIAKDFADEMKEPGGQK